MATPRPPFVLVCVEVVAGVDTVRILPQMGERRAKQRPGNVEQLNVNGQAATAAWLALH